MSWHTGMLQFPEDCKMELIEESLSTWLHFILLFKRIPRWGQSGFGSEKKRVLTSSLCCMMQRVRVIFRCGVLYGLFGIRSAFMCCARDS